MKHLAALSVLVLAVAAVAFFLLRPRGPQEVAIPDVTGLTQAQAAGLAGVGNRFLSELERGKSTVELGRVGAGPAGPKAFSMLDLRNPELDFVALASGNPGMILWIVVHDQPEHHDADHADRARNKKHRAPAIGVDQPGDQRHADHEPDVRSEHQAAVHPAALRGQHPVVLELVHRVGDCAFAEAEHQAHGDEL